MTCSEKGCSKKAAPRRIPQHQAFCEEHLAAKIARVERMLLLARGSAESEAQTAAMLALDAKAKLGLAFHPLSPVLRAAEAARAKADDDKKRDASLAVARAAVGAKLVTYEQYQDLIQPSAAPAAEPAPDPFPLPPDMIDSIIGLVVPEKTRGEISAGFRTLFDEIGSILGEPGGKRRRNKRRSASSSTKRRAARAKP